MTPSLALLVALGFGTGPFAGMEEARRPQQLEPFWHGLPEAQLTAPAQGIVVLRVRQDGRVRIAGGKYVMGSTPQEQAEAMQLCAKEPLGNLCGRGDERMWSTAQTVRAEGHPHEVTLSDFDLDVTEVTVERYRRCVSAGACSPPGFPSGDARYDLPRLPVTHVTWEDADAFCTWIGARLPTEAEWEFAVRGRVNNTFPWGKNYNPHLANHGSFPAADRADGRDGFLGLAPVGSFPDGATVTGVLDMAGNASEWVADWYDRDDQQFGYPLGAQVNPKITAYSPYGHVIRGGSYLDGAFMLRAAFRRASLYSERDVGFRCAADPPGGPTR